VGFGGGIARLPLEIRRVLSAANFHTGLLSTVLSLPFSLRGGFLAEPPDSRREVLFSMASKQTTFHPWLFLFRFSILLVFGAVLAAILTESFGGGALVSPLAWPYEASMFLIGPVATGGALLFLLALSFDFKSSSVAHHWLWRTCGLGITLWCGAALLAMPYSMDKNPQMAFESGGFLGTIITHYTMIGFSWQVGGEAAAQSILTTIMVLGIGLGIHQIRRAVFGWFYRQATGVDPYEQEEPVRPNLLTSSTGGRTYDVPRMKSVADIPVQPASNPDDFYFEDTIEKPEEEDDPTNEMAAIQDSAPAPSPTKRAPEAQPTTAPQPPRAAKLPVSPLRSTQATAPAHAATKSASPTRHETQKVTNSINQTSTERKGNTHVTTHSHNDPFAPETAQPAAATYKTDAKIVDVKTRAKARPVIEDDSPREAPEIESPPPANFFQGYEPPPLSLLNENTQQPHLADDEELLAKARRIEKTLADFGVSARVGEVVQGPVVTLFEIKLAPGTKLNKITALESDIALGIGVPCVRILAPIPGKAAVGIEVPNEHPTLVSLHEIISGQEFWRDPSPLLFALGVSIDGSPVMCDLAKMPHLLIAGATGSGKSVTLNAIISSILFHMSPSMVRMVMIDPKRVELGIYGDIPHLAAPVVCEPEEAGEVLNWVTEIMNERCRRMQKMRVRNIDKYNQIALGQKKQARQSSGPLPEYMPHMVVIIDELADLMLQYKQEVEGPLARLAQKARAAGIHLIVATQRPSVDVITGLIRANFPSRVAFQVSDKTDSRIIIQSGGAEHLLGRGDMLFSPGGALKPTRLQGAYVTEDEVEDLCDFLRKQGRPYYQRDDFTPTEDNADDGSIRDELYYQALRTIVEKGQATQSALTSRLNIGRTNAGRLLDQLERDGYVTRDGRRRAVAEHAEDDLRRLSAS
jgi:DNA segregation ATPase FtsK/SpoIIIE-like protein